MIDHTLICGDAVEALQILPSDSVHLTVFSPPYDAIRDYIGRPYLDLVAAGQELLRVTVDGGICACVIQDGTKDFAKSLTTFRTAVRWVDAGWRLFETCIYSRSGTPGVWWNRRFRVDHEYILLFLKGSKLHHFDKRSLAVPATYVGAETHGTQRRTDGSLKPQRRGYFQGDTKCRGTIWQYVGANREGNKLKLTHPATFPDALARDLIACFSRPGDTVLDITMGSGTTGVEAVRAGRVFVGVDIAKEYVSLARQRIAAET